MLELVQHPVYGQIVYEEGIWSGKKTVKMNGVVAQPVSKKEFILGDHKIEVKGSFITGVSLIIEGENIEISPKPKWYEILLSVAPFVFILIWGSSSTLCAIFPVIGGGIGGGLGGVSIVISLILMKNTKSPFKKLLIGLATFAATVFIGFLLAVIFVFTLGVYF